MTTARNEILARIRQATKDVTEGREKIYRA